MKLIPKHKKERAQARGAIQTKHEQEVKASEPLERGKY